MCLWLILLTLYQLAANLFNCGGVFVVITYLKLTDECGSVRFLENIHRRLMKLTKTRELSFWTTLSVVSSVHF